MTQKPPISICVLGPLDSGKSTLVGHLGYLLGSYDKKALDKNIQVAISHGKRSFRYAFWGDKREDEMALGVTINMHMHLIKTSNYNCTFKDTPGHRNFINTTWRSACGNDVAIFVVPDLSLTNSRSNYSSKLKEHFHIASAQHIPHWIICVNRMTAQDETKYLMTTKQIEAMISKIELKDKDSSIHFLPISALDGYNLIEKQELSWFQGPTLVELIDSLKIQRSSDSEQEVFQLATSRQLLIRGIGNILIGTVLSGSLKLREKIVVATESSEACSGRTIQQWNTHLEVAKAGDEIGICLDWMSSRNYEKKLEHKILTHPQTKVSPIDQFWCHITLLRSATFQCKTECVLFYMNDFYTCSVSEILTQTYQGTEIRKNFKQSRDKHPIRFKGGHGIVLKLQLTLDRLPYIPASPLPQSKKFLLKQTKEIVATGLILETE